MKKCSCGRPLPPICKIKGKCNWCASAALASRRKTRIRKVFPIKDVDAFHSLMERVWFLHQDKHGVCRCHNCGIKIGDKVGDATGMNFSHLLSKGAYPELYYDVENVDILCIKCHHRYEFGDKENMAMWPEYEVRIATLKQKSKYFRP